MQVVYLGCSGVFKRDVCIGVQVTVRPTIRVVSRLIIYRKNKRLACEPMRKH